MIQIRLKQAIALNTETTKSYLLEANVGYITADAHEGVFPKESILELSKYEPSNMYNGESLNGKSLICFRTGGLGDLFFISASLIKVKALYPNSKLTLVCSSDFINILKCDSYEVLPLPVVQLEVNKYDYVLFFTGVIEDNPLAEEENAYDLIARKFNIAGLDDGKYKAAVNIAPNSISAVSSYLNSGDINVLLHLNASVPKRSLPVKTIAKFISETPDRYKFHIIGAYSQLENVDAFVDSITKYIGTGKVLNASRRFKSIEECAALASLCNLVIGPDSGILHIAGNMDKPLIGLFGPFPSDLRLRYYKNAVGIDSDSNCEYARGKYHNCFEHGNGSCRLTSKTLDYFSPCMQLITSEHIHGAAQLLGFNTHKERNT